MKKIRKFQRCLLDEVVRRTSVEPLAGRAEFFVTRFEAMLPAKSRLLDIGGGWGFYAEPLERRGHHLTVLDVVKPGLQKAPVVVYDGGRFPFEDKSFEASLLVTMLHHVPDPEALIREAGRVTRRFLIVVEDLYHHPLGRFWTVLRDRLYNFEFFGHPCQFRKKKDWIELFERLGYPLVKEEEVYTRLAGLRILNGVLIFAADQSVSEPFHWKEIPEGIAARGTVPAKAEYFQDHFPRFPVLPGVMALEILKQIATDFLNKKGEEKWRLTHLSGVRFSAYLRPGDEWEARLECLQQEKSRTRWKGRLSSGGRAAAQAQFTLEN